jgi:membrane-associated phospholipid phosphatase
MKIKKSIMLIFAALCCAGSSVAEEMANYEAVQEQTAKTFQQIEAEMKFNKNWNGNWDVNGNANGNGNVNWDVNGNVNTNTETEFLHKDRAPFSKENWTWMHTNPGVRAYKPMEDLTFVGIPVFVAGWIAKSEKYGFKQQGKHSLVTNFKSGVDDYLQFFGPAFTVGLKVAGVEGRSDWGRFLATTAMSYGIMAGFVNGIKYTAKEMRPDGSTANSWPSGHTATAFVGATILHKEYGLTRSPWYSVAGYTVATATGIMRVLNNRHWVSDVFSGAGIGIMSTELAYALSDVIFKGKGLLRNNLTTGKSIIENPSFFSLSMGMGFGSRNMDFDMGKFEFDEGDGDPRFNLKFGTSTAVGVEGAYFFNKYFGLGGRLRVNSSPIKGWGGITDYAWKDVNAFVDYMSETAETEEELDQIAEWVDMDNVKFAIESDHLTEFAVDLGAYFNFPLSKRFALGTKFLVGRSIMQEINLEATVSGKV